MISVTSARYDDEYRLRLCFSDGVSGCVDLGPLVFGDHRPVVRALQDPALFRRFRVAMDTVVWDNGFDLAPEYLRALVQGSDAARN
jgi:hypothetical protein